MRWRMDVTRMIDAWLISFSSAWDKKHLRRSNEKASNNHMQKTKLPTRTTTYYEDYVAEQKQRAALREADQAQPKPGSDRALATAAQYEFVALKLRQAAHELEELHIVENVSYWEWKAKQEDARDRHQSFNALPLEFTHWLLLDEAQQLEARAREMRGGKS